MCWYFFFIIKTKQMVMMLLINVVREEEEEENPVIEYIEIIIQKKDVCYIIFWPYRYWASWISKQIQFTAMLCWKKETCHYHRKLLLLFLLRLLPKKFLVTKMLSIFLRSAIRSNIWFRSSSSSSLSSTKIIPSRCLSFRTKYENQFHSHYHNNRWNRYSQSIINYSNQSKFFLIFWKCIRR